VILAAITVLYAQNAPVTRDPRYFWGGWGWKKIPTVYITQTKKPSGWGWKPSKGFGVYGN